MRAYKKPSKSEELMNEVTGELRRSKNKYFVVMKNKRGMHYLDYSRNLEFLEAIKKKVSAEIALIKKEQGGTL